MKTRLVFAYIFLISWMIIIFLFSSQSGNLSGDTSNKIVRNIVVFISKVENKNYSEEKIEELVEKYNVPIRKLGHFTEYLILGILVMNLLINYNINLKWFIISSILICVFYAFTDEFHQLFINDRSGNLIDVSIDSFGSIFGIMLYYILNKNKIRT